MRKSHTKQALLSILLGPAGLFYTSVNTALVLILLTLVSVLVGTTHTIYILTCSFLLSLLCGWLLVQAHNKHADVRDFTLSTYIGQVSCKVIGKGAFKRDYSKPLARAKFKRRLRLSATYSLVILCTAVTGLIALPTATNQFDSLQIEAATIYGGDKETRSHKPVVAAALGDNQSGSELSNTGVWQLGSTTDSENFLAKLQGNSYQKTNEGFYRPTLTLSCNGSSPTLGFDAYEVLGTEYTQVTMQFDTNSEVSLNWSLKDDYRSAYTNATKSLLKKLSRSEHLQIRYRPFGTEDDKSTNFDLGESSTIVKTLRGRC